MQAVKVSFALVVLLTLTRFIPIYYSSSEFGEFVKHETARARSESQLKKSLLDEAREHSLPVKESDISINKTDDILRVTVDYQVKMNLLLFNHEMKFHTIASGLIPRG
jgi:hypothetical protein